jgi:DNA modification methylase
VLAGNATIEAAAEAGITKVQVVEADGNTIIAVRRKGLTDDQKRHLAIADNRAAELAEWDVDQLKADLEAGHDLSAFFVKKEIEDLLRAPEDGKGGRTDPDDAPDVRTTRIATGDFFELGDHRLLCGDCTKPEDVARVMGDAKAAVMNTDPPYGVDYVALKKGMPGFKFSNDVKDADIANDEKTDGAVLQAFLESAIRAAVPHLTDTCAFYLWHPMLTQGTFFAAAAAADVVIHRQIIWVKPGFVLTRSGMYHWKHELCFFGWRRGHTPPWYGERNQTSVWMVGRDHDAGQHPTQKPVALFEPAIANHTRPGEVVYEPFAGSGSQVIAAEQFGRRCFAIELEPKYCQVTIDRWEKFTGRKAVKVGEVARAS